MKARVDQDTCIGCGLCPELVPEIFEMVGEKATAKVNDIPPALEPDCRSAAEQCPVAAIKVG